MPKCRKDAILKMIHDQVEDLRINSSKIKRSRIGISYLILEGKTLEEIKETYGYNIEEELK